MKDWSTLLSQALQGAPDKVPAGWKTSAQLAKESGLGICRTQRALKKLVKQGQVEIKLFRVKVTAKTLPVPHYRRMAAAK